MKCFKLSDFLIYIVNVCLLEVDYSLLTYNILWNIKLLLFLN